MSLNDAFRNEVRVSFLLVCDEIIQLNATEYVPIKEEKKKLRPTY